MTNQDFESKHDRGTGGKFTRMPREENDVTDLGNETPRRVQALPTEPDPLMRVGRDEKHDHHLLAPNGQYIVLRSDDGTNYAVMHYGTRLRDGYTSKEEAIKDVLEGDVIATQYDPKYTWQAETERGQVVEFRSRDGQSYDAYDTEGNCLAEGMPPDIVLDELSQSEPRDWTEDEKIKNFPYVPLSEIEPDGTEVYRAGDLEMKKSWNTGTEEWRKGGALHRTDGAAIVHRTRPEDNEFWVNGEQVEPYTCDRCGDRLPPGYDCPRDHEAEEQTARELEELVKDMQVPKGFDFEPDLY